jgi:hypothetical protein
MITFSEVALNCGYLHHQNSSFGLCILLRRTPTEMFCFLSGSRK